MNIGTNLAHAAMIGLMAGAMAACNAGADATQADAPQTPTATKNGCAGPDGCGAADETKASTAGTAAEGGQAKAEAKGNGCSGPDGCGGNGCPAKDEAKADAVEGAAGEEGAQAATKSENSCSGANGCENS